MWDHKHEREYWNKLSSFLISLSHTTQVCFHFLSIKKPNIGIEREGKSRRKYFIQLLLYHDTFSSFFLFPASTLSFPSWLDSEQHSVKIAFSAFGRKSKRCIKVKWWSETIIISHHHGMAQQSKKYETRIGIGKWSKRVWERERERERMENIQSIHSD